MPESDSDVGQCWRVISVCGTVPDSGAEGRTVLGSATESWTVSESATEGGTVLDSASERGMGTMGTILCYNFSDVTMSHYGKILSLLMCSFDAITQLPSQLICLSVSLVSVSCPHHNEFDE